MSFSKSMNRDRERERKRGREREEEREREVGLLLKNIFNFASSKRQLGSAYR